jgi:gas vesicle protein
MRMGKYESSESSNIGTALTFFMIGLGAGALAGLLLAPKSGKQLRRDIKSGYDDALDTVGDWADQAKDKVREAGDRVRDAGERVRDVAQRGVEMAADLSEDLRDAARDKVEPLRRVINRG